MFQILKMAALFNSALDKRWNNRRRCTRVW